MATIRIQRKGELNNILRTYNIFINGNNMGKVANGQVVDIATTSGLHQVTAKLDIGHSPSIAVDLEEGETKILKVGGFKYGNWLMPMVVGIILLHFVLLRTIDFSYTKFLLAGPFLVMLYFYTLGRKRCLTLDLI